MILDNRVRERIRAVVAYAEANKYLLGDLLEIQKNPALAAGHNPNFIVEVPMGFACVFTIEQHPGGWMRHLSVSVEEWGRYPNEVAVRTLAREFGFVEKFEDCMNYVQPEDEAVNVLERIKP